MWPISFLQFKAAQLNKRLKLRAAESKRGSALLKHVEEFLLQRVIPMAEMEFLSIEAKMKLAYRRGEEEIIDDWLISVERISRLEDKLIQELDEQCLRMRLLDLKGKMIALVLRSIMAHRIRAMITAIRIEAHREYKEAVKTIRLGDCRGDNFGAEIQEAVAV